MKLIVQPDDGMTPIVHAVRGARRRIDIMIFRFDRPELQKALAAAVARGVPVRALIAHTNRGGEKRLRKLELQLLDEGVTVARTDDDLPRYHGKLMVVDDTAYVLGFNFTRLDIEKSRSFGIATSAAGLVQEVLRLFEADATRQTFVPSTDRLVVSPENSRKVLSAFIKGARRELLLYDQKVSDRLMLRLLEERRKAGVEIRLIGRLGKAKAGIENQKLKDLRLHVRAMIRDGAQAFIGSQSLRKLELDGRREVGVILTDAKIVKRMHAIFESDWEQTGAAKEGTGPEASQEAPAPGA